MYKYETHLHTFPVSKCGRAEVEETLNFYKKEGYDGVFITNHLLDGNLNMPKDAPYKERINFYFSDYEKAKELSTSIGIKVFLGIEISYKGTDFLIYNIGKQWFLEHPEYMELKMSEKLALLREAGAFIVHAHPFREAKYIDHIRLFPRLIDGVEVINAARKENENKMADIYATEYNLLKLAGSDNHRGGQKKLYDNGGELKKLAGINTEIPINSVEDFRDIIKSGNYSLFYEEKR